MGRAMEVLTGFVTAPGATLTAVTMASGNSLTVRNAPLDADVRLLNAWADNQAVGVFRVRSPKLHDNVQGIRLNVATGAPTPLLPMGVGQRLIPQDTLIAELSGSGTAGDIETGCMLIYYANLPGTDARLGMYEEIMRRAVHIMTVENTLASGTAGGYSGEEAINAEFDQFKANTDYALLGAYTRVEAAVIRFRGADTGNMGFGVPGDDSGDAFRMTSEWFKRLALGFNLPLIPVMNAANKSNFLIDCAQDENGSDPIVTSVFVELSPGVLGGPAGR